MKCEICGKRRKTAGHNTIIPTEDGQDIKGYDIAELCVKCSKNQHHWSLNSGIKIKGNRFIEAK